MLWAAPVLLAGGAADMPCLDLSQEVAIAGVLHRAEVEETRGQPDGSVATEQVTVHYLMPDAPGCAVDDAGERIDFARVHVWSDLGDVMALVDQAVGRRVTLTGEGFPGHTAHHYAPLVLKTSGLATLDGEPIPEHAH